MYLHGHHHELDVRDGHADELLPSVPFAIADDSDAGHLSLGLEPQYFNNLDAHAVHLGVGDLVGIPLATPVEVDPATMLVPIIIFS